MSENIEPFRETRKQRTGERKHAGRLPERKRSIVKIYATRNGKYQHYELAYYLNGKRVREHKSNLEAANERAADITQMLTVPQPLGLDPADAFSYRQAVGMIAPTGKALDQVISEHMDAVEKLKATGASIAQVVEHFLSHRIVSKLPPEVVTEFLAAKRQDGVGKRHLFDLGNRLTKFGEAFACPISSISGPAIDDWLREQQEKRKWQGQTRNHCRAAISNLMGFAISRRYLPTDWNEMRFVSRARVELGEIEVYTPEQAQALMDHVSRFHRPYLALALFAGIRQSEIIRMDWKDIWWDHHVIDVGKQKIRTAGHRYVPLHPNCEAWLRLDAKESGPVCAKTVSNKLVGLGRKAGVAWQHNAPRHSYITYRLVVLGGNADKLAAEAGNSKQMIDRHYRRPIESDVAERYFSVMPH